MLTLSVRKLKGSAEKREYAGERGMPSPPAGNLKKSMSEKKRRSPMICSECGVNEVYDGDGGIYEQLNKMCVDCFIKLCDSGVFFAEEGCREWERVASQ